MKPMTKYLYTYGAGTRLSSAYTLGRDGKPCPPHSSEKTSAAYEAWKTGREVRREEQST